MLIANIQSTLLALALLVVVHASPLVQRDVIAPKIITPNSNTQWVIGDVETVTWDTSNFPPDSQITNPIGQIILGHEENNSLNLDFAHPLASGFKLRDGSVQVTVPDVPPRDDYLIVLFGDSGNTSPAFTITKITSPSSPGSSSSSPVPSGSNTPAPSPSSSSSSSSPAAADPVPSSTPSPPPVFTANTPVSNQSPSSSLPSSTNLSPSTSTSAASSVSSAASSFFLTPSLNLMAMISSIASALVIILV